MEKKEPRYDAVITVVNTHPDAGASDILVFISEKPIFYEDAAIATEA